MSIFKETFKDFVRAQLRIREAVLGGVNEGNESRTNATILDLSDLGQNNITIDPSAFYTNTVNRQCTLRLSSGVNLKKENNLDFDDNEFPASLIGNQLALRYVLEGGTPFEVHKKEKDTQITENEDGSTKTDTTTQYKTKSAIRKGFGASEGFGQAYGDSLIRANSKDEYGIVPMPGIIDADIRTKSAYGSLREGKVTFVCYNLRQLEILELLYMRPGYPLLLEWAWSPFIDNEGKRRNGLTPKSIPQWWDEEVSLDKIHQIIIDRKTESGGNYDAMIGFVKNFNYVARPDGGFNCTTEIISRGDVLTSLKGTKFLNVNNEDPNLYTHNLDNMLKLILKYSAQTDLLTADEDENVFEQLASYLNKTLDKALNVRFETYDMIVKSLCRLLALPAPKMVDGKANSPHLAQMILTKDRTIADGTVSTGTHIRLDAFFHILNVIVVERDEKSNPLVNFSAYVVVNDDKPINDLYDKENKDFKTKKNPTKISDKHMEPLGFTMKRYPPTLLKQVKARFSEFSTLDSFNPKGIKNSKYFGLDDQKNIIKLKEKMIKLPKDKRNFSNIFFADILDVSIDPTVCFLPHQLKELRKNKLKNSIGRSYVDSIYPPYAAHGVSDPSLSGQPAYMHDIVSMTSYSIKESIPSLLDRQIGHIYLSVTHLQKVFNDMTSGETEESSDLDKFNLFDYVKRIMNDVSNACGGAHKFELQADNERNVIRIVDLQYQNEKKISKERNTDIVELNIQGNNTIFRDFNFNSAIPSAMSATIAIAANNPATATDLEKVTFSAINQNIQHRFGELINTKKPDPEKIKKERIQKRQILKKKLTSLFFATTNVYLFYKEVLAGEHTEMDDDGNPESSEEINKMKGNLREINNLFGELLRTNLSDGKDKDGNKTYAGFPNPRPTQQVADIIPLKFNAILDGISGIVIGNVFKIDPSRLPSSYRDTKERSILFICTTEEQKITSKQDWTTTITGQITIHERDEELQTLGGSNGTGGQGSGGQGKGVSQGSEGDIDGDAADTAPITTPTDEEVKTDSPEIMETTTDETSDESQLNLQDQCGDDEYWDEELQACVLQEEVKEEQVIQEEINDELNKDVESPAANETVTNEEDIAKALNLYIKTIYYYEYATAAKNNALFPVGNGFDPGDFDNNPALYDLMKLRRDSIREYKKIDGNSMVQVRDGIIKQVHDYPDYYPKITGWTKQEWKDAVANERTEEKPGSLELDQELIMKKIKLIYLQQANAVITSSINLYTRFTNMSEEAQKAARAKLTKETPMTIKIGDLSGNTIYDQTLLKQDLDTLLDEILGLQSAGTPEYIFNLE